MLVTAGIMWKILLIHAKLKYYYEAVKHFHVDYYNVNKQFTFSQYS